MRTAFCFLTDELGFGLTEHAVAVAALTQRKTHDFIVFCVDFEPKESGRISALCEKRGINLKFKAISLERMPPRTGHSNTHVTAAASLKLYALDEISREYDRAVYLDSDILLMKEVNVDAIDFEGRPIAAVYDIAEAGGITFAGFHDRCAFTGRSPHYFNSGLICVDFGKWTPSFLEKFNAYQLRHSQACEYKIGCRNVDQCAINMTFERNWARLPLTFNFQACAMFSERWTYATVRHYVGRQKFLPNKAHRRDSLERQILNGARKEMGLGTLGLGALSILMKINTFRNRRHNKIICEAIDRTEKMRAEAF